MAEYNFSLENAKVKVYHDTQIKMLRICYEFVRINRSK